ncbi:acyltransferase family protein [Neptunicella marina]|uniref:Acyltransferase family protein n=1 Tax=Neptunicella marina TaxID=2125989 RepID=A0A8J6IX90_9ALTE|nr:acyltransferase family protein [Neptunicella marina]MBC3767659.1 acyltransferase family protein [Neptunicella marina]
MTQIQNGRRYDIDALRVLAFMLLILYHIGMYYVQDWGWHVKSPDTYSWLQDLMLLVNQWRMCLLFILSGMALALIKGKYSAGSLIWLRSKRLMIPLIFSMYVIVAPQLFYQLQLNNGYQQDYLTFWLQYINAPADFFPEMQSVIGLLTWNHLWYLPYLWVYSIIMLAIGDALKKLAQSTLASKLNLWHVFAVLVVVQTAIWMGYGRNYPETHDLVTDWYAHSKYLLAFSVGYMLVMHKNWWQQCIDKRLVLLGIAVCGYIFIFFDNHGFMPSVEGSAYPDLMQGAYSVAYFINRYAWLFAVIGLGGHYLNRSTPALKYANDAVLPWYIFHQTLIVVFAMWLRPLALNDGLEFVLLTAATVAGCAIGYELVRRLWITRVLFGLK